MYKTTQTPQLGSPRPRDVIRPLLSCFVLMSSPQLSAGSRPEIR